MTTARAITIRPITIRKPLTLALIVLAFTAASAAQATFKVIHTFTGKPDGISPWGALINDNHGNVYGTTTAGGAMVMAAYMNLRRQLIPGASGQRT